MGMVLVNGKVANSCNLSFDRQGRLIQMQKKNNPRQFNNDLNPKKKVKTRHAVLFI
jgi:hypothetical protein